MKDLPEVKGKNNLIQNTTLGVFVARLGTLCLVLFPIPNYYN